MTRAEIRPDSDSFSVARFVTHAEVVAELADIEAGIDDADLRAVWCCALFGWKAPTHLEERVARLRALRDQVGHESSARKRGAA